MTPKQLLAIGLGAYVFALIAELPVSFADSALRRASSERLRLVEAEGRLWSGNGQIEFRDAGGQAGVAKSISWRCSPWSLLGGRLVFDVDLDQSPKHFPVSVSFSQIKASNVDIHLPVEVIGLAMPKLIPLGLGGDVLLQIEAIVLQRDGMQGKARLQWRSATSTLTSISPLGDYELRFAGEGKSPKISLHTVRGPLTMEGKEVLAPDGGHIFLVTLRVPALLQQQLAPLLRLIAVEHNEGVFTLQVK